MPFYEGFESLKIDTSGGATINLVKGGDGPPLLLLHGYPQSHMMWHKIAPRLAEDFTVVVPDLRGYGDSSKVPGDPEHLNYSKRAMAQDQVDVMAHLGFDKFRLVGHDRGARVSHRLTKDHQERIERLMVLDIIPTHKMFQIVNKEMATNTYHWFFLIQPYDFPERVIGADPDYFVRRSFSRNPDAASAFPPEVVDEYARCFSRPRHHPRHLRGLPRWGQHRPGARRRRLRQQGDRPHVRPVERHRVRGPNARRAGGMERVRYQRAGPVAALRPLHTGGDAGRVVRHHQVLPARVGRRKRRERKVRRDNI